MKPSYCTQNKGKCETCSLVNYGRDCMNVPITENRKAKPKNSITTPGIGAPESGNPGPFPVSFQGANRRRDHGKIEVFRTEYRSHYEWRFTETERNEIQYILRDQASQGI